MTQLEQLAAPFKAEEHKTRSQGGQTLTYVSIDATIKRLNEVLGPDWSTSANTDVALLETGGYLAVTQLVLTADIDGREKRAYGVGAMTNKDPDMAAKTALAEAIKKAGHQLGIALYLWDPAMRDAIARRQKVGSSVAAMKREVFTIAQEKLGHKPEKASEVAKVFGVKVADLTEADTLRSILEREGIL